MLRHMSIRQTRVTTSVAAQVLVLCYFGCGGSNGVTQVDSGQLGTAGSSAAGTGGTTGALTVDNFGMAFEDALCGPEVACQVYANLATCEAATVFAESTQTLTDVAAVHRGTSRFNPTAAAACLAALPTYCFLPQDSLDKPSLSVDLFNSIPACFDVFTGLLSPGAPCASSTECANHTVCAPPLTTECRPGTCCPGTCVDYTITFQVPTLGQACSGDVGCVPPAVCRTSSTGISGACVMPPAEGEPCPASQGLTCGRLDDYCSQGSNPTCMRRIGTGTACDTPSMGLVAPCYLMDLCGGTDSSCYPVHTLGDPCSSVYSCPSPLTCVPSDGGVCAAPTPGTACTP
jgi:hypothetical protein